MVENKPNKLVIQEPDNAKKDDIHLDKPNLIVHIGAGKTGTSSIQKALFDNQDYLNKQGVRYLGLMFEYEKNKKYSWQYAPKIGSFYELDANTANKELLNVLRNIIDKSSLDDTSTYIWSNESLLVKSPFYLDAFKQVSEIVNLKIVVYVRDYAKWSISAYKQWGIKHKTEPGPVRNYKESKAHKVAYFYRTLKPLLKDFSKNIIIRNMDSQDDVVKDFLSLCNISAKHITYKRVNESLSQEELFLRAIFNTQFNGPVRPEEFENIVGKFNYSAKSPSGYLATLLPSVKDIEEINHLTEEDRCYINSLLKQQQQKEIEASNPKVHSEVDLSKFVSVLSEIIIKQSIKINKLEQKLL